MAQPLSEITAQRIAPDGFEGSVGLSGMVGLPTTGGLAQVAPTGSPVAGSCKTLGVDEGLEEINGMLVDLLPIRGNLSGHPSQQMGGQAWNFDPIQDKESSIVSQKMQVLLAGLDGPADKSVSATDMPWSRRPAKTGDRSFLGEYHIFEMFSHRLDIAQIMELGDESVIELLKGSTPHLMDDQGTEPAKIGLKGTLVNLDPFRFSAMPVAGPEIVPPGRQLKVAFRLKP